LPGRFAYAPDTDEPFLFQQAVRLSLGSEVGAHRQALRKQPVDVSVGVPKAAEDDVGDSMFARQPRLEANGSKYVRLASESTNWGDDCVEPLLNALVQVPNRVYAK